MERTNTAAARAMRCAVIALSLMLGLPQAAHPHFQSVEGHAHERGTTYTSIGLHASGLVLLYTLPAADAARLLPDASRLTPEDVSPQIANGFAIQDGSVPCQLTRVDADDYAAIDAYQYKLHFTCPSMELLTIDYRLFLEDGHVNYVDVWLGPNSLALALEDRQRAFELPVAYLLWERGWRLPAEAPALSGEKPSLLRYLQLGFAHVLSGLDHLAFVLGLVLLVPRFLQLAGLITSFTIAHSITLGLASLDVFVLPAALIEPLIALSIIYVGLENLVALRGRTQANFQLGRPALLRRWISSFAFGLVHGFGFSYMLREVGLPPGALLPSLAMFNVGVELGQLSVVIVPFIAFHRLLRGSRTLIYLGGFLSIAITAMGAYWLLEGWLGT